MLQGWNDTDADVPAACIHRLFEEQVDRTPDANAVIFEDRPLTYRQLDERANRLAWYLIELGVGPDHLVGVHVNRSIDLVVAVLAVHKAGGAYVPLDPAYPADRLHHMIRDSGCRVILTDAEAIATLPLHDDAGIAVVRVDADRARFESRPTDRPRVPVRAAPPGVLHLHVREARECPRAFSSSTATSSTSSSAWTIVSPTSCRRRGSP